MFDKFISDGDQRVFSFPSPYDIGVPDNPLPVEVKKRMFKFLESGHVSGLKHAPAVEADTEKLVIGLGYWFIEEKCKAINQLATDLQRHFSPDSVEDLEVIIHWQRQVERIQEASRMDWKSFTHFLKDLSKEIRICERAAEQMEKLIPMGDFILTGAR